MDRANLKSQAKNCLGNNIFGSQWLQTVLIIFVFGAIISAVSVTGVGPLIIIGPLTYGISFAFLRQARQGGEFSISDLFAGFKHDFGNTFLLGLMMQIFITLWSFLFIIPGIVKAYAYSMAYYIKIDHPDYDWRQCLKESERITKGHKGELFLLDLSFIGWSIVGGICFGIGTFWVSSYMYATKAQYYMALSNSFNVNDYNPYQQNNNGDFYSQPNDGQYYNPDNNSFGN